MAVTTVRRIDTPLDTPPPLEGYGVQLNVNLFTRTGGLTTLDGHAQDVTDAQLELLQDAIADLKPGHCRIFVEPELRPETDEGPNAPVFRALMDTIGLVEGTGATVNLTWWHGPYAPRHILKALTWENRNIPAANWPQPNKRKWPRELTDAVVTEPTDKMRRFALLIAEARKHGTCVTHATVQNEVNGAPTDIAQLKDPGLSMRLYEWLYRRFQEALEQTPDPSHPGKMLRDSITIVAGDLLERPGSDKNTELDWISYMHRNMDERADMPRALDAYSSHVYWNPNQFPTTPMSRLDSIAQHLDGLHSTRPFYITEYGVRWLEEVVGGVKKKLPPARRPGILDGKPVEQSKEAAFQHAWFDAYAAQVGCAGVVKWVLYRTDLVTDWGEWGILDSPKKGFTRTPVYRMTRLFSHVAPRGWRAAGLWQDRDKDASVMVSRFAAPTGGDNSAVVLNAARRAQQVMVTLEAGRRYVGAHWNLAGKDQIDPLEHALTTDGDGHVLVPVPARGVTALATRQLGL
jgi:hypothetical protein